MRLVDTHTGQFVEKDPRKEEFKYAILSHTWDPRGEQTYQELKKIQERYSSNLGFKNGFRASPRIRDACVVARKHGYRYIWIDSCCIDKTSSSELSEAINSMYSWYKEASLCYVYLADVPVDEDPREDGSAFRGSRWFTRGWTLQELIAPTHLSFFSKDWKHLGSKEDFAELVNTITNISTGVLLDKWNHPLHSFSVAQRLSWAASRETTRVEDRAYSLMGIFDINMTTLYGEGSRAFQRLQEEILQRIPDQSIFAWGDIYLGTGMSPGLGDLNPGHTLPLLLEDGAQEHFKFTGRPAGPGCGSMFAESPDHFVNGQNIQVVPLVPLGHLFHHYPTLPVAEYGFTPHGIRTHIPLIPLSAMIPPSNTDPPWSASSDWYLAVLGCEHVDRPGRLLGRVCLLNQPTTGFHVLYPMIIHVDIYSSNQEDARARDPSITKAQLFSLSAESLVRSSELTRVLPVHVPRSNQLFMPASEWDMRNLPHKTINLLLKRKDDNTGPHNLNRRLSNVDEPAHTTLSLRWPDRGQPNTHWLTISRLASQDAVELEVEYTHTLEDNGKRLTIVACVRGVLLGFDITPVTLSWIDEIPWGLQYKDPESRKRVEVLDNGQGGAANLELILEYLAPNHYTLDAHVQLRGIRNDPGSPYLGLEDRVLKEGG